MFWIMRPDRTSHLGASFSPAAGRVLCVLLSVMRTGFESHRLCELSCPARRTRPPPCHWIRVECGGCCPALGHAEVDLSKRHASCHWRLVDWLPGLMVLP